MPMRGRLALELQTPSVDPSAYCATRSVGHDPPPLATVLGPLITSLVASSARIKAQIAIGSFPTQLSC
jgi:hypothetical protein